MPRVAGHAFQPRKTPLQARSTITVDAIMQAAVQVLQIQGKARLTTTRVAQRAGVSVGTLYQYFPNKSSLLQTVLKEHLEGVAIAMEDVCTRVAGKPLDEMAAAVIEAFVWAKFRNIEASEVLYAVSDDVEGKRIAHEMHTRVITALTRLLNTAQERAIKDPAVTASTLLHAITGVSRGMLEAGAARRTTMPMMQAELTRLARAYLEAAAA